MAVFGTEVDRPLYGRGPSPGLRLTGYAVLAVVLMYYDQHGHWEQRLRYALEAAAYPVQIAVNSPSAASSSLTRCPQRVRRPASGVRFVQRVRRAAGRARGRRRAGR